MNRKLPKKRTIPTLRFPGFEGVWEEKRLGEIGRIVGGGTPSTKDKSLWYGSIPWVSSSDLDESSLYKINTHRYISNDAIAQSAAKIIPKGSILIISRVGVGKMAINTEDISTSQDFLNLTPKDDSVVFLAYLLKTSVDQLLSFNQGSTIKGFTKSDLEGLALDFPPLPEQQKIASFLSATDSWIENLCSQKKSLEEYKKGMMQKIFSQEIRFKQDDGTDYPEWEEKRLGEVADSLDHRRIPVNESDRAGMKGDIPYWGANNIMDYVNDYVFDETIVLLAEDGGNFAEFRNRPIAHISYGKSWVNNHAHVLKAKEGLITNEYIYRSLVHKNITAYVNGGTRAKLNKSDMLQIKLSLPALPEQQKIASCLESIDNLINLKQQQIDQANVWKKGLMQGLLI